MSVLVYCNALLFLYILMLKKAGFFILMLNTRTCFHVRVFHAHASMCVNSMNILNTTYKYHCYYNFYFYLSTQ